MPVGNVPGWRQVFADDFLNQTYPVGSFTTCTHHGCAGVPSLPWGATSDGTPDNSGHCEEYPSQTLSISGGVLNVFLHTAADGVCMVDQLRPIITGFPNGMTYGMYSIRFRANAVPGYKLVDLFWPVNSQSGEIDFPEDLDLGAPMTGFFHLIAGGPNTDVFKTQTLSTGWNTATVQWTPTSVAYILNGTTIGTVTTQAEVPQTPMYVSFETDGQVLGAPKPPATASGNLQIAWATVYAYDPVAPTLTSVTPATIGTGVTSTTLTLRGQFMPGSAVTFSNPGITEVAAPTYVSSTELEVPVDVALDADLGSATVAVSDVAGKVQCTDCLTVESGPGITSSTPAVAGATVGITVTGHGFRPGLQVQSDVRGVTFGAPTVTTPSQFTVSVSTSDATPVGSYDLTVTDSDPATGAASCGSCLSVVDVPSPPVVDAVSAHNHHVTVTFTPPANDGGQPIVSYTVSAIDVTNPANGGQTATGTRSPIIVGGLINGDTYHFRVTASNGAATSRPSTASANAVPSARPHVPTIGDAQAGDGKAVVSFVPGFHGGLPTTYTVTAIDATDPANGGQTATGWQGPLTVHGLVDGDSYTFVVTANNADGTSGASTPSAPVTPATTPGEPGITSVTPAGGAASIVFRPPGSDGGLPITSYSVSVQDVTNPPDSGQIVTGISSPIEVTGLTVGDAYRFVLRAVNGAGPGPGCASRVVLPAPK